jgi:hypothetical protein
MGRINVLAPNTLCIHVYRVYHGKVILAIQEEWKVDLETSPSWHGIWTNLSGKVDQGGHRMNCRKCPTRISRAGVYWGVKYCARCQRLEREDRRARRQKEWHHFGPQSGSINVKNVGKRIVRYQATVLVHGVITHGEEMETLWMLRQAAWSWTTREAGFTSKKRQR